MEYNKQAMTLAQQIDLLKQRGLIIDDEPEAERVLDRVSYFRLAGYWRHMEQDRQTHRFREGSRFETIVSNYRFDNDLRSLIFNAIRDIEVAMRSKVISIFSLRFGPFWFMDEALAVRQPLYADNLGHLNTELHRTHDDFIAEHFLRYDTPAMPPAWKTLEVASMGTLSKLYRNFSDPLAKHQVARSFGVSHYRILTSWLECLTVLRNCCAHHARVSNRHFQKMPRIEPRMSRPWIANLQFAPDKLYPQLCCIAYWQNSIAPTNTFASDLKTLLARYPTVSPRAMGFPCGWQTEPLWQ